MTVLIYTVLFCGLSMALAGPALRSKDNDRDLFEEFVKEYEKVYEEDEYERRFRIFQDNLDNIARLNYGLDHEAHGINMFTDHTKEEFAGNLGCSHFVDEMGQMACEMTTINDLLSYTNQYVGIPKELDWRKHNLVTPVAQQGNCGTCWAFATIGNIEGQLAKTYGTLIPLSKQHLFDCIDGPTCKRGYSSLYAFSDLLNNNTALVTEYDYPYWSGHIPRKQSQCPQFDNNRLKVKIDGCEYFNLSNEEELKTALFFRGPLSVGLHGTALHILNRNTNYIGEYLCDVKGHDDGHAVLLVGYGEENGEEYWLLKNSWGEHFGDKGYFRMKLGVNCLGMFNHSITSSKITYFGANTRTD